MQKAIFLDRDGTISKPDGMVYHPEQLTLIEGSDKAIKTMNKLGYLTVVITNQTVVARGLCDIEDVELINNKMLDMLKSGGAVIDEIYFCPHHPQKGYTGENPIYKIKCDCRKPGIGLIKKCLEKHSVDLENSWFAGDTGRDILTGKNAGVKTALVLSGESKPGSDYGQDETFNDLSEFAGYLSALCEK